jgi:hypothetical protein
MALMSQIKDSERAFRRPFADARTNLRVHPDQQGRYLDQQVEKPPTPARTPVLDLEETFCMLIFSCLAIRLAVMLAIVLYHLLNHDSSPDT